MCAHLEPSLSVDRPDPHHALPETRTSSGQTVCPWTSRQAEARPVPSALFPLQYSAHSVSLAVVLVYYCFYTPPVVICFLFISGIFRQLILFNFNIITTMRRVDRQGRMSHAISWDHQCLRSTPINSDQHRSGSCPDYVRQTRPPPNPRQ